MTFSHGPNGSNPWTWARCIALLCVCMGTLVAVVQLGERTDELQVTNSDSVGATANDSTMGDIDPRSLVGGNHAKVFLLLEDSKSLRGQSLSGASANEETTERQGEALDDEPETLDEDEEFYQRMLGKGYGSGPYSDSSSKSSKSKKHSGKGGSKGAKGGKPKGGKKKKKKQKKKKFQKKLFEEWRWIWNQKKQAEKKTKKPPVPSDSHSKRRLRAVVGEEQVQKHESERHHESQQLRRKGESKRHTESKSNLQPVLTHVETQNLQSISTQFYIYDDPVISQSRIINKYRRLGKSAFEESSKLDHVKTDMKGEQLIFDTLKNHPLRTSNPDEAELFIVPTPITELLAYGCQWENCTWYDEAFNALSKQPAFKKAQGHKHVIVALSWPSFNKRYSAYVPALSRNYHLLENVTVAHNYDPFGCVALRDQTKDQSSQDDFRKVYHRELPVTNAFSLGLGFNDPFPVHLPTYEKFETSDFFLFYRSRVKGFAYGSTKYRNAALDENVIEKLPPSSIGHDVPYDEWVHGFTSSKFCLVVRGDTPHSHSLLYAVRGGCIPVVVSDDYPLYAPPFKSSIAIEDFAIFIKEEDFIADPARQLLKLQDLPEAFLRTKLENLYVAQTMVVPNHPRSLFVQAFLKEAFEAEKNVLPSTPRIQVRQDYATLSGSEFLYRYPSTLSEALPFSETKPVVIVGVVSKSPRFNARHAIRGTWAAESQSRVLFIVAGPWEDIEEEFHLYGDMLWLDMVEEDDDDSIDTNKVQFLLQAVNKHVDSYDYVMKTKDDTYVWLDDVERHLAESKPDYWGTCKTKHDKFDKMLAGTKSRRLQSPAPTYAYGTGYVLSRSFNKCAASYIESMGLMSNEEDVATGLLAELCNVSCSDKGWDWWKVPTGGKKGLKFIHGHLSSQAMLYKHFYVLWRRGGWDA